MQAEFDHMKFQPDRADGVNLITRIESGAIWVRDTALQTSILVPWEGPAVEWSAPTQPPWTAEHFAQILALGPELVIFGSGARLKFPAPAALRPLYEARVGVETMDTAAACRTFNVLVTEGRKAVAALLIPA
jgi:uncharacterized protein